jgi:hypothetical protein
VTRAEREQVVNQGFEIVNSALEAIGIVRIIGLVGSSATEVIGNHDAMSCFESVNNIAVKKRPSWVAVNADNRRTGTLVEIVQSQTGTVEVMRGERKARCSPIRRRASGSSARYQYPKSRHGRPVGGNRVPQRVQPVNGSDTVPILPNIQRSNLFPGQYPKL